MLHMGKGDLKEPAFSAGSHFEPINENRDVSEILSPSAPLAFNFVWAIGTSFPWHTASPASACKACSLSCGPYFYFSICLLFKKKNQQNTTPSLWCFPSSLHPLYLNH